MTHAAQRGRDAADNAAKRLDDHDADLKATAALIDYTAELSKQHFKKDHPAAIRKQKLFHAWQRVKKENRK